MTQRRTNLTIIVDRADAVATSPPVAWAVEQLRTALAGRGMGIHVEEGLGSPAGHPAVVVAGPRSPVARDLLGNAGVTLPAGPEALALVPGWPAASSDPNSRERQPVVLVCGSDARGLVYALLEMADRLSHAVDPAASLHALLPEGRPYGVLFRVWPGTHRLLLWGDPVTGRGYGRAFSFCGAQGAEFFEPLSFSGRRGSGLPEGRDPYRDDALRLPGPHGEWEKFGYTYRLWGRLLYNPDAPAETWRRALRHEFGPGAEAAEAALAHASRILPLVTTAHHPSAANNNYWPEIYTNMPILGEGRKRSPSEAGLSLPYPSHPYGDTASPKRFGNVSALDPELFSSVDEYVEELVEAGSGTSTYSSTPPGPVAARDRAPGAKGVPTNDVALGAENVGRRSGRYSPIEVARWLEDLAAAATEHLAAATAQVPDARAPAFRRWAIDVRLEAALGRFYAEKLRAAVGYSIYTRVGDVPSLQDAVVRYRAARDAWAEAARFAQGVYKEDLTFGPELHLRGHWADRLAAIDADVQEMAAVLHNAPTAPSPADTPRRGAGAGHVSLRTALEERRPQGALEHTLPATFTPGQPLSLEIRSAGSSTDPASQAPAAVRLHYRHVTQAERFQVAEMGPAAGAGAAFRGAIPASYTDTRYPLQYYFEAHDAQGRAWLWPGLNGDLANQPYFVVRSPSAPGGDPDQR